MCGIGVSYIIGNPIHILKKKIHIKGVSKHETCYI
jgi:hypothetical protein